MTLEEFDDIRNAVEILQHNKNLDKLEGKRFRVYRVGTIIRVDINE